MNPPSLLPALGLKVPTRAPVEKSESLALSQVILVDSREKRPMPFPPYLPFWVTPTRRTTIKLVLEERTLKTADYVLGSAPAQVGIERKANLDELHANLCTASGRKRFLACLDRLSSEFAQPVLFLEGTPGHLVRTVHREVDPTRVRDQLMSACAHYGVSLLMLPTATIPQRRVAAEWLASLLIAGALHAGRNPKEQLPGPG